MAARRAATMLRLGVGSAALASIPAMTYNLKVFADDGSSEERCVKIAELPIYENPEDKIRYRYLPEEISPFRQAVSNCRQVVWDYLDCMQETTDKVKEKYYVGKAHTEGLIDYLQNDPGMLPRAAVISVAGLGGIVAGYKGGVMRKMFLSAFAITAATSLCYPKEAIALTTEAYNLSANTIQTLWCGEDSSSDKSSNVQGSSPSTGDKTTKVAGDLGQSKAEDKDLYTTRSR